MNCIIVEDEFPAREELKYFIKNYSKINIKEEFDNGVDVIKFLQENKVDAIFLDINIPLLDGMVLAKTISNFKEKPKIIFITAYKEHAIDAFELEAFDYILKPYSDERIISMLNKLEKSINEVEDAYIVDNTKNNKSTNISIWKKDVLVVVNSDDIYYCEANKRETLIFTKNEVYTSKLSIKEFEKYLQTSNFFKTHRSYVVNIDKIKEIVPWFNSTYKINMKDINHEVYVSRSNIKKFKEVMNI